VRTALAGLLAVAIVVPALPSAFWNRMSTIMATANERDQSETGRLHFWKVAVDIANAHPVTGIGFNAYQAAYDTYDTSGGAYSSSRSVHSIWFGVLAEMGYPGLFLYLLIIGQAFTACARIRKRAARGEIPDELGRYAVAFESAFVAFIVGGTFVPFQYDEMLWHFFGLTIALESVAMAATVAVRVPQPEPIEAAAAPTFAWGPG
jgi:O-antigen ligase